MNMHRYRHGITVRTLSLSLCSGETPALYTVLPEKTASVGGAMMGSSHVYDMASAVPGAIKKVSV